jgi:hypothetical protein
MLKPPKRTKMTPNKQLIPMMPSSLIVHEVDFIVKETNLDLGKVVDYNHHYDLVEHMTYLFIHVVKTCGLATKDLNGTNDLVRFFCHPTFVHHLLVVHWWHHCMHMALTYHKLNSKFDNFYYVNMFS